MGWMKFVGTTMIAAGAAYGFGWYRGCQLPLEHQVKVVAVFPCSVEKLWLLIGNLGEQTNWKSELTNIELISQVPEVWEEDYQGTKIQLQTEERIEGQRLVRVLIGAGMPYQGSWTYDVEAQGEKGAKLTVTETARIKHPVLRYLAQGFLGYEKSLQEAVCEMQGQLGPAKFLPT